MASRTLNLKLVLPTVDLRWVIRRAPWLLTEEASHSLLLLTATSCLASQYYMNKHSCALQRVITVKGLLAQLHRRAALLPLEGNDGVLHVLGQDGAARAEGALRKLKALMPALPVEERLLESSLWNNFASLLRDRPVQS